MPGTVECVVTIQRSKGIKWQSWAKSLQLPHCFQDTDTFIFQRLKDFPPGYWPDSSKDCKILISVIFLTNAPLPHHPKVKFKVGKLFPTLRTFNQDFSSREQSRITVYLWKVSNMENRDQIKQKVINLGKQNLCREEKPYINMFR